MAYHINYLTKKNSMNIDLVEYSIIKNYAQLNMFKNHAIVLESIARGGGSTKWYFCKNYEIFCHLTTVFTPGSQISFFFQNQFRLTRYNRKTKDEILEIIAKTRECVVGYLKNDMIEFEIEFVSGPNDLADFITGRDPESLFMFGQFPGSDNDGVNAITSVLPDRDGIIRNHPY